MKLYGNISSTKNDPKVQTIITSIYYKYMELVFLAESMTQFKCPYCERKSASPGGVRFHVKLTHPEKLEEFNSNYYPEMEIRFKAQFE